MPENDGRLRDDFRHAQERRHRRESRLQSHYIASHFAARSADLAGSLYMRSRDSHRLLQTRGRMAISARVPCGIRAPPRWTIFRRPSVT